jgi:hypothetical protein
MLKTINYLTIFSLCFFFVNNAYSKQEIKSTKYTVSKCPEFTNLKIPKEKIKKKIITLCINEPELISVEISLSTPNWWMPQDVEDMLDYFLGHFGISDINSILVVAIKVKRNTKDPLYLSTASFAGIYNPESISLVKTKSGFILNFTGGSTANAYTSELHFDSTIGHPTKRIMKNSPVDDYTETTIFQYPQRMYLKKDTQVPSK